MSKQTTALFLAYCSLSKAETVSAVSNSQTFEFNEVRQNSSRTETDIQVYMSQMLGSVQNTRIGCQHISSVSVSSYKLIPIS